MRCGVRNSHKSRIIKLMNVGDWVKYWREKRTWSQDELAKKLGWTRDKLHRIEVGDRKRVDLTEILQLCRELKRPVGEVVNIASQKIGVSSELSWHFLSVVPQSWVSLVDGMFKTDIASLLHVLSQDCDEQWGFNYELESKTKEYYSNVHSTVMFLLFRSRLLTEGYLRILQDALFALRDSGPRVSFQKSSDDKYAWDSIEGPSCFSTSLACYALLLTGDNRTQEITESVKWLLEQRNDKAIWPVFKKGGSNNFATTFYSILALKLLQDKALSRELDQKVKSAFVEVKDFIEGSLRGNGRLCYVAEYESNDASLSNTIISLYLLKFVRSEKFNKVFLSAKGAIDGIVSSKRNWWISVLAEEQEKTEIKRMYTYNPAYLPLLLRMGWSVTDKTISKMLSWVVSDLRTRWVRENVTYLWRSSDSIIQSFICMFSIFSIYSWLKESLRFATKDIGELIPM